MEDKNKIEADEILKKFPNRVPIIILTTLKLGRKKFLVNENTTLACFIYMLRQAHIKILPSQTLYIFFNNTLVNNNLTFRQIYKEHKSSDNFLYANIVIENTFG